MVRQKGERESHEITFIPLKTHFSKEIIKIYCIALRLLYCVALRCIASHCMKSYCIVLYRIVLYCIVLYLIVLYCIVLYCIVLYCLASLTDWSSA